MSRDVYGLNCDNAAKMIRFFIPCVQEARVLCSKLTEEPAGRPANEIVRGKPTPYRSNEFLLITVDHRRRPSMVSARMA